MQWADSARSNEFKTLCVKVDLGRLIPPKGDIKTNHFGQLQQNAGAWTDLSNDSIVKRVAIVMRKQPCHARPQGLKRRESIKSTQSKLDVEVFRQHSQLIRVPLNSEYQRTINVWSFEDQQ